MIATQWESPPTVQALAEKMGWYMELDAEPQVRYSCSARRYALSHFSIEQSKEYFQSICFKHIEHPE